MKRAIYISVLFLSILICMSSCRSCSYDGRSKKNEKNEVKPASLGAPYELLVICAQKHWDNGVKDAINAVMTAPVEMLNQKEPLFSVMRIQPRDFKKLLPRSRNILNIAIGDKYDDITTDVRYDVYASPQIIVTIYAPDAKLVETYMMVNSEEMVAVFEMAERNRNLKLNSNYGEKNISKKIKEKFDFDIEIPKGYIERDSRKDFMWISCEYPTSSQGMVIYRYPYTGKENFQEDDLIKSRDKYVSLIPAENPGSHMTTYKDMMPELKHLSINGRYWAELRGFWDTEKDYMGGPFVSYSTLDTENNMVTTIDCYVYSPDKAKRNLLRHLEHVIYSVRFPGNTHTASPEDNEEIE